MKSMTCPVCNIELKPADRQGIEIDYCPHCRGVWIACEELDRVLGQPTPFDWGQSENDGEALLEHEVVTPPFNG
jgi:Zn-finger nucleic acid-binding protein